MKNFKYISLLLLAVGFVSCDVDNSLKEIPAVAPVIIDLEKGSADFTKYVAIGASFTAGYTDGALFMAGQKNSYPNIMSKKFAMVGGGDFNQPLTDNNIGGLTIGGYVIQPSRLYFNGAAPVRLAATPTTDILTNVSGGLNNFGVPGAKSFHLVAPGYGNVAGVALGLANPYFARMASSSTAMVLGDALAAAPTFFSFSEVGGNDVLSYALAGGAGVDQSPSTTNPTGNLDPSTYGSTDITNPLVFASVYSSMVNNLTAGGAKGVVSTLPYITSLSHFTTIPHNPVPLDAATAGAINAAFAPYNGGIQAVLAGLAGTGLFSAEEAASRIITFAEGQNALVIIDESLTDLEAISPAFAGLKKYRQATADDLIVLTASSFIGTKVAGNPQLLNGITVPLGDKWVLTPSEQISLKTATDAYNATIEAVAASKGLAIVDFKAILEQASTTGIGFDEVTFTTQLVLGGLISLDGIHLTAKGYAFMANQFLKAIDVAYGSNFSEATDGLAKAKDYGTNYSQGI